MKKLNLAIIGQGRSGKDIHGRYYRSEDNIYYNIKYVVELDAYRRELALKNYPGCQVLEDYKDLYGKDDIDLVVNASYSEMHYAITKDLLNAGFNVLVEKPFARTAYECRELIKLAEDKGVTLAVFQQSFYAPYYQFAKKVIADGTIGDILQVNVRFNGFARRWDWQTILRKVAGGLYNTGPHPVGFALGFLDFDKDARIAYSKLGTALTSGDGDDYAKIILTAPGKPCVDVEVCSNDAYSTYNIKLLGTKGTLVCRVADYQLTYIKDGENVERPVIEESLKNEELEPIFCSEQLIKHIEEAEFDGDPFSVGTPRLYEDLYFKLTEGRPMQVNAEMAAEIIRVIEGCHVETPLPVKF